MKNITIISQTTLTALFGLAVYVFFVGYYPFHLHYQEQLQMFLFSFDYFKDFLKRPAGIADYLGTFVTQFYYISWLGALILTLLLVLIQQLVVLIVNKFKHNFALYPLTYIPSFGMLSLLCDENYLLTSAIALIISLSAIVVYFHIARKTLRLFLHPILIIILYWVSGYACFLFVVAAIWIEIFYFKSLISKWLIAFGVLSVFVALSLPLLSKFLVQYPLARLWFGIGFNRYPLISLSQLSIVYSSVLLIVVSWKFLPVVKARKAETLIFVTSSFVVASLGTFWVIKSADMNKEEIMAYDYYARNGQWKEIIKMANRKDPSSPLSVACLNLALSQDVNMGDCMFRYYQNGPEGLLPSFQRDFTTPFITGEIYYHLGFLNTSMRFAFEAMEAIPDYKKSSRAMKRMAEVNLLNGEYEVATKYLHLLQKTLFYRDWASETLKCIGNPAEIDKNVTWKLLRKYRISEDFLFSEQEKDQMLGLLFLHAKSNKMAYEYLMAYTLLTKDLGHFIQYFPLGNSLEYTTIPAHYQEALAFVWYSKQNDMNQMPWNVSKDVKQFLMRYIQSSSGYQPESAIKEQFSQTYWYYLQYRR